MVEGKVQKLLRRSSEPSKESKVAEESERKLLPLYRERESNPPSACIPLSVLGKRACKLVCRLGGPWTSNFAPVPDAAVFPGEDIERALNQFFFSLSLVSIDGEIGPGRSPSRLVVFCG